ncbi:hypothetical protein KDX40_04790 [Burkholderia ambifaria]|uniref:DUF6475 domain-containing protein n=1 Tax=Burkholderia ambifaria TaxID=152480 RepID=UPI001B9800B0|nr:DUF6475 domain-containing protein [Burkholderia ambifaria]MBR8343054.1 hypothetical protein [Burkholderia ambifaria]
MTPDDFEKFHTLLSDVYAFYGKDISTFAVRVWTEAMRPFDFSAVAEALNRHLMNPDTGQFLPKPSDVVKVLQGSTQDSALVAWSKVDSTIRHKGTYVSVVFDDPIIHRVILEMGGWVQIGGKSEDDWPFVRNEFVNRYRGYKTRGLPADYPAVLIGIADAQNARQGFGQSVPLLVGNPEQAQKVLAGGSDKPLIQFTSAADVLPDNVKRLA